MDNSKDIPPQEPSQKTPKPSTISVAGINMMLIGLLGALLPSLMLVAPHDKGFGELGAVLVGAPALSIATIGIFVVSLKFWLAKRKEEKLQPHIYTVFEKFCLIFTLLSAIAIVFMATLFLKVIF